MKLDLSIINKDDPRTLHRQLRDLYADAIQRGIYKPGEKIESEQTLIRKSALSYPTVSRALSDLASEGYLIRKIGSGSYVSPDFPKPVPLHGKIGIFYWQVDTPLFFAIFEGIQKYAALKSLEPVPIAIGKTVETENSALAEVERIGCLGIIGIPVHSSETHRMLLQIARSGKPVVFLNSFLPKYPGDSIMFDNVQAGYDITRYLLEQGHRRIAFFGNKLLHPYNRMQWEFRQGIQTAMEEIGLSMDPSLEFFMPVFFDETDSSFMADFIKMYRNNTPENRPTAAVCIGDGMAYYVIASLTKEGISVPTDVSVTGLGGIYRISRSNMELTTVDWPTEKLGQKVVQLLLDKISFPDLPQIRIILDCKLSIGETTCPPKFLS